MCVAYVVFPYYCLAFGIQTEKCFINDKNDWRTHYIWRREKTKSAKETKKEEEGQIERERESERTNTQSVLSVIFAVLLYYIRIWLYFQQPVRELTEPHSGNTKIYFLCFISMRYSHLSFPHTHARSIEKNAFSTLNWIGAADSFQLYYAVGV